MKLSKNFSTDEFNGVSPDSMLLAILQSARDFFGTPIKITDSTRTVQDHITIYKKIYKDEWMEKIPWGSRHLPCWHNPNLRAVDIKVKSKDSGYLPGKLVAERLMEIADKHQHRIGLGIGHEFVHIDIDRGKYDGNHVLWEYNY